MKNSLEPSSLPLLFVITDVWLILLALCTIIWKFIVPISSTSDSYFVIFILSSFKVGVSLIMVVLWLIGWYKALNYLLAAQFYMSEIKHPIDSENNQ